jgi:hypothetical protein
VHVPGKPLDVHGKLLSRRAQDGRETRNRHPVETVPRDGVVGLARFIESLHSRRGLR